MLAQVHIAHVICEYECVEAGLETGRAFGGGLIETEDSSGPVNVLSVLRSLLSLPKNALRLISLQSWTFLHATISRSLQEHLFLPLFNRFRCAPVQWGAMCGKGCLP